ncbi:MAG TPA: PDZ domain-containing protein [Marmoricola sp.]|nr:PDZ domain-containing protein [Marmoricola sp.]
MSRRTTAGLLALGLIVVLGTVGLVRPVHYVTFRPGPTMNVLGTYDGKTIVNVTGHKTYRDDGALRMVTVFAGGPDDEVTLAGMLYGWADPDIAVLPSSIYRGQTEKSNRQESAVEMTSSQDSAVAAAFTALGIKFTSKHAVGVGAVAPDGASAGKLRQGDVLVAVDGKPVTDSTSLVNTIRAMAPGTSTTLTIRRDGAEKTVSVTTKADPQDPKVSRVGISVAPSVTYSFPFKVKIDLPDTIGGPSAGMMFALAIYDVLTPGSLTGGKVIAGSGEITPEGKVGPIGGIAQKLPAAQRDGARLFLVAADNCAEAVRAHYDSDKMRLVKVNTLADAIKDVDAWRKDPSAALPRCTR